MINLFQKRVYSFKFSFYILDGSCGRCTFFPCYPKGQIHGNGCPAFKSRCNSPLLPSRPRKTKTLPNSPNPIRNSANVFTFLKTFSQPSAVRDPVFATKKRWTSAHFSRSSVKRTSKLHSFKSRFYLWMYV